MNDLISPKYQMNLVKSIAEAIHNEYSSLKEIEFYIKKWYDSDLNSLNFWENFRIEYLDSNNSKIDLFATLHNMSVDILLKVAIDLGVDTPDFIPTVSTFKNNIKSDYKNAYDAFMKAFKSIEADPDIAIGLANSALESIIKEIIKDSRISAKLNGNETLYKLTVIILKEFNIGNSDHPVEIRTIGSSLLSINQSIEKLRSEKTNFHGKANDDLLIQDPIYAYFIINCVTTLGLFLDSFYRRKFGKPENSEEPDIELPW